MTTCFGVRDRHQAVITNYSKNKVQRGTN